MNRNIVKSKKFGFRAYTCVRATVFVGGGGVDWKKITMEYKKMDNSKHSLKGPLSEEQIEEYIMTAHPLHILWTIVKGVILAPILQVALYFMYSVYAILTYPVILLLQLIIWILKTWEKTKKRETDARV